MQVQFARAVDQLAVASCKSAENTTRRPRLATQEKTKGKYRTERKNRDAFRDLLRQHGDDGKISSNTFWGDYAEKVPRVGVRSWLVVGLCRDIVICMSLSNSLPAFTSLLLLSMKLLDVALYVCNGVWLPYDDM